MSIVTFNLLFLKNTPLIDSLSPMLFRDKQNSINFSIEQFLHSVHKFHGITFGDIPVLSFKIVLPR